ncbi:MAG: hypothetical protein SF066_07775 [Thermoanaerobaculia bacterium]|nr:hypothetical protein [Thermoanaerobaculia bacterium]
MSLSRHSVFTLFVLAFAGPLAAQPPDLIFQEGFNAGNWTAWGQVISPSAQPNCDCYFSGDCAAGNFCNWGPGGPFTEDICNWRTPKPGGVPGNGCTTDSPTAGPICDGFCSPTSSGSTFANEKQRSIETAVEAWTEALLRPAERPGGGPVDAAAAQRALAVSFESPFVAWTLGRHVADVLMLSASPRFYDYFCHFEFGHESPEFYVDLSTQPCHLQAGYLSARALLGEFLQNGEGVAELDQLQVSCPQWQEMFAPRCPPGPDALECVKNRVRDAAVYLRTVETAPKT